MKRPFPAAPAVLLLTIAAAAPAQALQGTYSADCAPYDGPAFRIVLRAGPSREIELRANAPLADMAHTWTHSDGNAQPRSALIAVCKTRPERVCSFPERGTFTVQGEPGREISGSFTAAFAGATGRTRRFTASPRRGGARILCG